MMLNLSKKDGMIFAVCVAAVAICAFFLLQPDSISRSSEGKMFGLLESSVRDVRLKPFDQSMWYQRVAVRSDLYENDRIFTGQNSFADIRATTGEVLRMQPESLVLLQTNGDEIRFDLQQGIIEIFDNKSKSIKKINAPARFSVSKKTKKSQIVEHVTEMNAPIILPAPAEPVVEKSLESVPEQVAVEAAPEKVPEQMNNPVKILKVFPILVSLRQIENGKRHRLQVETDGSDPSQIVEISKDKKFNKIIASAKVKEKIVFKGLKEGEYFVRTKSNRAPSSVDDEVMIQSVLIKDYDKLSLAQIKFPVSGQLIVMTAQQMKTPLRAKNQKDAEEYEFQLSKSEKFENPKIFRSPSSTAKLAEQLESGDWYIRVRGLSDKSLSDWSKSVDFTVDAP